MDIVILDMIRHINFLLARPMEAPYDSALPGNIHRKNPYALYLNHTAQGFPIIGELPHINLKD